MLKLYRMDDLEKTYWETWQNEDGTHTIHWGELGTEGENKTLTSSPLRKAEAKIQSEIDGLVQRGYTPINIEDHRILLIEFKVDEFGTGEDLEKRHRLESRMSETLGWTGLGHCDGGSIGLGSMEVCCYVVDFELAKNVITNDLRGTEFADFARMYDEDASDA